MLSNMTVNYTYGDATGSFANANVIFGNIPCRPINSSATGVFTNDSIQRIEADITDTEDFAKASKGEEVAIVLDYVAFTVSMTFTIAEIATSRIRADGEWYSKTIITLSIDPTATVTYAAK